VISRLLYALLGKFVDLIKIISFSPITMRNAMKNRECIVDDFFTALKTE
jgi:hypothetical protein